MPTEVMLSFPATTVGMIAALEAIEQTGTTWKLSADLVSRVRIVVEELFSNTIKYGYGEECRRPVRLWLRRAPTFSVTYEDEAPPFDPTQWRAPSNPDDALADREPGQAGIALIMGLSSAVRYSLGPRGNRLDVAFASGISAA